MEHIILQLQDTEIISSNASFYRWLNWGQERFSVLPEISQEESDKKRMTCSLLRNKSKTEDWISKILLFLGDGRPMYVSKVML